MEGTRVKKNSQEGKKITKEEYEEGSRLYFKSINQLPTLFIEAKKASEPYVYLDIRNLIVLLIYESYRLEKWIKLRVVRKPQANAKSLKDDNVNKFALLKLKTSIVFENCTELLLEENSSDNDDDTAEVDFKDIFKGSRKHPSVTVEDKKMVICGISSVLRFLLKFVCYKIEGDVASINTDKDILLKLKQFLGFRGGCLQACAESSIWTKFCEVDMISSVNELSKMLRLDCSENGENSTEVKAPENVKRFENHLSLPVKIHNFKRVVRDTLKTNELGEGVIDKLTRDLKHNALTTDIKHEFAEGPTLLLSDLILFPSFHVFILLLGEKAFGRLFPKTLEWHDKVQSQFAADVSIEIKNFQSYHVEKYLWSIPDIPVESLYLRDTNRYKPSLRQFTRQYEVVEALENLKTLNITSLDIHKEDSNFNWTDIPLLAHPEGGSLPRSRRERKCDQLASMAHYALQVYSAKKHQFNSSDRCFRIVDFCSGGGHVGILLAWLLPDCDVVLVENKDESLRRAQERVSGLGISNVFCYQSNLDYFETSFDMGMALHACGTATDLVISKCVKVNASFVCCPCCYGAVQENHILNYPQSTIFQSVSLRHYLILCHASDQTEAEAEEKTSQGKQCMAFIDSDRCLYAAENRYDVKLCKIVPETASPKNHILVAISSLG